MNEIHTAMERIKDILEDDANYQNESLKLGGIWGCCDHAATFRRFQDIEGADCIEVISRDQTRQKPEMIIVDEASNVTPEMFACLCKFSDAWRCARSRNSSDVACSCRCHRSADSRRTPLDQKSDVIDMLIEVLHQNGIQVDLSRMQRLAELGITEEDIAATNIPLPGESWPDAPADSNRDTQSRIGGDSRQVPKHLRVVPCPYCYKNFTSMDALRGHQCSVDSRLHESGCALCDDPLDLSELPSVNPIQTDPIEEILKDTPFTMRKTSDSEVHEPFEHKSWCKMLQNPGYFGALCDCTDSMKPVDENKQTEKL